jgi:hypothetical protein
LWVSGIGIFILLLYATTTFLQWQQARRANDLALRNFRDQHRAWVLLDGLITTDGNKTFTDLEKLSAGNPLGAHVIFKNSGGSPAKNVAISTTAVVRIYEQPWDADHGEQLVSPFESVPDTHAMLASGGVAHSTAWATDNLTKLQLKALLSDFFVIWVHGRVAYEDAFGVEHWTRFCSVLLSGGGWAACKYGNETDQNPELPPSNPWW